MMGEEIFQEHTFVYFISSLYDIARAHKVIILKRFTYFLKIKVYYKHGFLNINFILIGLISSYFIKYILMLRFKKNI